MSEPPSIHSVSLTIVFAWEQSHPKLDRDEFFSKLGSFDDKGNLIRRIVVEIKLYDELSLVPHGQDPYAQIIQNDKIVNPEDAANRDQIYKNSFTADDYIEKGHWLDYKLNDTDNISLSISGTPTTIPDDSNNNNNENIFKMDKELLKFFKAKLGLSDDVSEEQVVQKIREQFEKQENEIKTVKTSLQTLEGKYPENSVIVTDDMQAKLNEYEFLDKLRNTVLSSTKTEAVKLYKILCGGDDKVDESILKMINEGGYETVIALNKQYKKQVEEKFIATCNDCGSTDVNRASMANPDTGIVPADGNSDPEKDNKEKGTYDVMEKLMKKSNSTATIHDVIEVKDKN